MKKGYNFYRDVKRARIGWNKGRRTEVEPSGFLKKFAIWEAGETRLGSNWGGGWGDPSVPLSRQQRAAEGFQVSDIIVLCSH